MSIKSVATAVVLAATVAVLSGCVMALPLYQGPPPEDPETAAPPPGPSKPCTVNRNKDGTIGTSC